jgi:hypothetical protein
VVIVPITARPTAKPDATSCRRGSLGSATRTSCMAAATSMATSIIAPEEARKIPAKNNRVSFRWGKPVHRSVSAKGDVGKLAVFQSEVLLEHQDDFIEVCFGLGVRFLVGGEEVGVEGRERAVLRADLLEERGVLRAGKADGHAARLPFFGERGSLFASFGSTASDAAERVAAFSPAGRGRLTSSISGTAAWPARKSPWGCR